MSTRTVSACDMCNAEVNPEDFFLLKLECDKRAYRMLEVCGTCANQLVFNLFNCPRRFLQECSQ